MMAHSRFGRAKVHFENSLRPFYIHFLSMISGGLLDKLLSGLQSTWRGQEDGLQN